jgi:predicted ATP-binding protein involved in virulence
MDAEKQSPEAVKTGAEFPKEPPKPIYFLSLEVENVRCFKDRQTLTLADEKGRPKRWTVLLGDNGVGKTTLLQLLALFRPEQRPSMDGNQLRNDFSPRLFTEPHPTLLRRGATFTKCNATLCYGVRLSDSCRLPRNFDLNVTSSGWKASSSVFPSEAEALLCFGYGTDRRMSQRALPENRSEDACKTLFEEGEPLLNAEDWLRQADHNARLFEEAAKREASRQSAKSNSEAAWNQFEKVKEVLLQILPEVENLEIRPGDDSLKAPAVEAKTPYGWVMLRNLSSGYRSVVAWTVDLASRMFEAYPESLNPLAEAAVVLVDQIDLYLHPKWQVNLIQRLVNLFPNVQFITTAHSPLIVQAAEDANIVVLRREGDHVIIENNPEKVRGWRVDQILTSDIFGLSTTRDPATEKLLQDRRALLAKATLSEADQARLKELDKAVAGIPFMESPQDLEAMELIRKVADMLRPAAAVK